MKLITPAQCRAARALLDWSQPDLARSSKLHVQTICAFENQTGTPTKATIKKIMVNLEIAGIEFLEHGGVRPRPKSTVLNLEGHEGFKLFMQDVMHVAENMGGDICVSGVDERQFEKWQGDFATEYLSSMAVIRNKTPFTFRILIKENDDYFTASAYAQYRSVSEKYFSATPFYVYGDRLAMILFEPNDVTVYIIQSEKLADAQRKQFMNVWETLA
jgi:transcriptional regulator with XRE-family HTH domain